MMISMREMVSNQVDNKLSPAKKPIRVLQVFNYFNQGGIENFVMNVYRNIDRSKIQFDFAFPCNKRGYFDEEAISLGGNIYFFDSEKKSFWNYYRNLKRIIKDHGPYTAVHSHIYYFSGYVLLIAKLCGVKIRISHSHETKKGRKQTLIRRIYEKVMRKMIKWNATDWLACSDLAGKYVFGSSIPYQVLYNGIDLDRFVYRPDTRNKIRKELGLSDNNKMILNVGRFADQKNHRFIIEILRKLVDHSDDYRLVMIGTGPLEDIIRQKCKEYGLIDRCHFLHNIQNTEDYYCAADVFLLPSLYEGMGIVCMEAQATGLQSLLSTEVPKEIAVTDVVHYLNLNDPIEKWVKQVRDLAELSIQRDNYSSLLRATVFDIERTDKDLTNIYLRGE